MSEVLYRNTFITETSYALFQKPFVFYFYSNASISLLPWMDVCLLVCNAEIAEQL